MIRSLVVQVARVAWEFSQKDPRHLHLPHGAPVRVPCRPFRGIIPPKIHQPAALSSLGICFGNKTRPCFCFARQIALATPALPQLLQEIALYQLPSCIPLPLPRRIPVALPSSTLHFSKPPGSRVSSSQPRRRSPHPPRLQPFAWVIPLLTNIASRSRFVRQLIPPRHIYFDTCPTPRRLLSYHPTLQSVDLAFADDH